MQDAYGWHTIQLYGELQYPSHFQTLSVCREGERVGSVSDLRASSTTLGLGSTPPQLAFSPAGSQVPLLLNLGECVRACVGGGGDRSLALKVRYVAPPVTPGRAEWKRLRRNVDC